MSCLLRISGESLDIDALLSLHSLPLDRAWKKGEPRVLKGKFHLDSGLNILVSDANLDQITRQIEEATNYLELNAPVLAKISAFPGVQNATLDFGIAIYEGHVAQFSFFPAKFIQLVANAGISLEVSHYACCNENE
ncbi:MAG: hypothetical protein KGM99_05350 [Burkholderiales bacterium]|nr:hypothetical protein [Burkholderiales bacterium]